MECLNVPKIWKWLTFTCCQGIEYETELKHGQKTWMEIYETVGHTNTVHFYGVSKGKTTIVRYLFILFFHRVQYAVEQ